MNLNHYRLSTVLFTATGFGSLIAFAINQITGKASLFWLAVAIAMALGSQFSLMGMRSKINASGIGLEYET